MTGILVQGVSKSFGETRALTDASLAADMGEVHAIVGENGSGKSTLAKIISGVLAPDGGTVDVLGETPGNPCHARRLGVAPIFQEMMLAEQLSIAENVFAGSDGLLCRTLSAKARNAEAKALLERLSGQAVDPTARVSDLPLHLKQWVVLARAICIQPRVLILDESSAALDLAGTERLHAEIRRLRDGGACILIVTHRIAELVRIADKATVLRDGRTVGTLSKFEITEQNLLKLMSAEKPPAKVQLDPSKTARSSSALVLRCEALQLARETTPFGFELREGEIVGVAGLDGAGHAEFIRTVAGIDLPSSGSVTIFGSHGQSIEIRSIEEAGAAGLSYVSGDRKKEGIFPALSTFENFAMAPYGCHRDRTGLIDAGSLRGSFAREVARLGIKVGPPNDRITSLSGGNQQKVLIARAFAAQPKVIVLNDPARGVDIGTKQELYRQLVAFSQTGGAVIYLSSEIEEFFDFADRVDVFVQTTLHRSLPSRDLSEEALLYAMFGRLADAVSPITVEEMA
ncbi:sugar ABC transporter ATP-binding protein [Metarhizobium album]|uniref:Sugar ABC transporter ATP-binding protein n=1 Tax=Metarhizobium album TaxID=2182425 RepID=A0A2U2DJ90_9HYPH|nr:sugar ABC transporter ATP-binding protein [Rhizobium album]PWE53369.1 sugar ABC transporter ATP-binding protein [Rhizobium album]